VAAPISKIQDDGSRFVLHGPEGLKEELERVFSGVGLGVSVTDSGDGRVNLLYTENNRDIVLRLLRDSFSVK
jgi:hypothetical protein